MDYKENRTRANLAQRDVAVFFALIGKVPNGYGIGIVEHKLRSLESTSCLARFCFPFRSSHSKRIAQPSLKVTMRTYRMSIHTLK